MEPSSEAAVDSRASVVRVAAIVLAYSRSILAILASTKRSAIANRRCSAAAYFTSFGVPDSCPEPDILFLAALLSLGSRFALSCNATKGWLQPHARVHQRPYRVDIEGLGASVQASFRLFANNQNQTALGDNQV